MLHFIGHRHVVFLLFLLIFSALHACTAELDQVPGAPKGMVQQQPPLYSDLNFRSIRDGYAVYTAGSAYRRQVGTFSLKGELRNYTLASFSTTIKSDTGILDLREAIEQRIQHWNEGKR